MDISNWLPAISTTSLLAAVLWLCRELIATRLTKTVQYEFDKKLEATRAEFRQREELLKADLRSKETDIAALRSSAISAMASRHVALDKRRLEAVDQLWSAVISLGQAKAMSALLSFVKFEEAAEEAEKNPKMRQVFEVMSSGFDINKIDLTTAERARPFVSLLVWALFSAYRAITLQAVVKLQILKTGVSRTMLKKDAIAELLKTALPHQQKFIDEYGDAGYHHLLDELETRLLNAISDMLEAVEADKAAIEQAAKILRLSNDVMASVQQQKPA